MKQRSQGSGAKPIHRREVFNGTDTDTKAKSEPEKSALYLLERQTGRYGDSENPHSIGCEGFRGFYSYLKE